MTQEQPTYISVEELPGNSAGEAYPYDQWVRDIPEGMALEITDQLNGRNIKHARTTVAGAIKRKGLAIIVIARKERLFIVKPKPSA